jgi:Domain of unknown function (DUF4258)
MTILELREKIFEETYLIKSHAINHALKEGFDRRNIIEAVSNGKIIEIYEFENRLLICGQTKLTDSITIYLHIVCEHSDDIFVEIITAYIPDEDLWLNPPFKRRK